MADKKRNTTLSDAYWEGIQNTYRPALEAMDRANRDFVRGMIFFCITLIIGMLIMVAILAHDASHKPLTASATHTPGQLSTSQ